MVVEHVAVMAVEHDAETGIWHIAVVMAVMTFVHAVAAAVVTVELWVVPASPTATPQSQHPAPPHPTPAKTGHESAFRYSASPNPRSPRSTST
ncbi:hypothetical protein FS749_015442 [Ceratobasidium sp. UAMH 11750]|nr:hypothetical protein FS749_015442 [Ceratobasidium sp. UAMH 11750]